MVYSSYPAQRKIIQYIKYFHALIKDRGGNGLDIPKFHPLLHFVRIVYILGSVPQYDGSMLESSGKYLAKC